MFVEFWNVGVDTPSPLPLTTQEVAGHIATDWVPSFPASVGSSFVGWPPYLLRLINIGGFNHLTLTPETGYTERQWKGVLSWMLGVAGTRHVLRQEGYRWIAPLSAFYPEAVQPVNTATWNGSFPSSVLTARSRPGSSSRLRPDYIALRPSAAAGSSTSFDWAAVESKGTSKSLQKMRDCPAAWSEQARNVIATVNGTELRPVRHLVIATRVHPNAKRLQTRRLQVRAWNSVESSNPCLPSEAAGEIAAAHVFGLFRSLGLKRNAHAIAVAVQERSQTLSSTGIEISSGDRVELLNEADEELHRHLPSDRARRPSRAIAASVPIVTAAGVVEFGLSQPLVEFARNLQRAQSPDEVGHFLTEADPKLGSWESLQRQEPREPDRHTWPFGIDIVFPSDFTAR